MNDFLAHKLGKLLAEFSDFERLAQAANQTEPHNQSTLHENTKDETRSLTSANRFPRPGV